MKKEHTSNRRRMSIFVLSLCAVVSTDAAQKQGQPQKQGQLAEAEVFVELNETDGDLGLHASIDGEPWTMLEIDGPVPGKLLHIFARGHLRKQGLTQVAFESDEPDFEELDPEEFFARFPEGQYQFRARALDGGTLVGTDSLSHVLAAPPSGVALNGIAAAENCDAEPLPLVNVPVTVSWNPVVSSHPSLGRSGPVEISLYQFFVDGDTRKMGVDLPSNVTQFEIPEALTPSGEEIKFEIIARTGTGNNTAIESCFIVQ
jgi:hypothetical protein